MNGTKWLNAFALALAAVAVGLLAFKNYRGDQEGRLLNVFYDPTREVCQEINSNKKLYQHLPVLGQGARDSATRLSSSEPRVRE